MTIVYAAILSFILDLLLGDPAWIKHPVVIMGWFITKLEKPLRETFEDTPEGQKQAGAVLAGIMSLGTLLFCVIVLSLLRAVHPALSFILSVIWGWQTLAMRDLKKESMEVYDCLKHGTLDEARYQVSRIVGRDTENLTRKGVIKACVETIAENFSDGVAAPMMYLLIGGAPLAMCYKAINTMDSMVGYKNEKYFYFGCVPAKLDDAANFIPSRAAAGLLILAFYLCRMDGKNAYRIFMRDRGKHASPNSAQTESAMAGGLCVELAGPAVYFGKKYNKPYIGDPIRPVNAEDIVRANQIMYVAGFAGMFIFAVLRTAVVNPFY